MDSLEGRVALVTGASRGIGEAIARRFASEGAEVAAVARTLTPTDRMPGSLQDTVDAIRRAGGRSTAFQADLSSFADRQQLVHHVEEQIGPIDILVNNAAVSWLAPVDGFASKHYDLMFAIQVQAPFELIQAVLPTMRRRQRGWILNVSSLAAVHPTGPPYGPLDQLGTTVYGMCKAALERLSTGLAAELYADAIAVNSLAPSGIVATWGTVHHHLIPEDQPDQIEYPAEFAEAALALCSGDPRERTGMHVTTDEVVDRPSQIVRDLDGRTQFVRPINSPKS